MRESEKERKKERDSERRVVCAEFLAFGPKAAVLPTEGKGKGKRADTSDFTIHSLQLAHSRLVPRHSNALVKAAVGFFGRIAHKFNLNRALLFGFCFHDRSPSLPAQHKRKHPLHARSRAAKIAHQDNVQLTKSISKLSRRTSIHRCFNVESPESGFPTAA